CHIACCNRSSETTPAERSAPIRKPRNRRRKESASRTTWRQPRPHCDSEPVHTQATTANSPTPEPHRLRPAAACRQRFPCGVSPKTVASRTTTHVSAVEGDLALP